MEAVTPGSRAENKQRPPAISRTYLPLLAATLLPPPHGWRGYGRSFSDKQDATHVEPGYPGGAWSPTASFYDLSSRSKMAYL
mmetsp:Transcript_7607/g.15300  ORF Transcript_7607/g.15300 Transcript_7607/m.15300 type:complete len:82 (+) Transcript_7607:2-247(+)